MKRRILLVDDEVAVLLTLKAVLEISGFDVDTATSGREGKHKLRSREYHMVITDMRMENDEAGKEVIAAARTAPYHPAVALLTAFPVAEEDFQELGADKMLVKPMHTKVLLQQIDKLMAAHESNLKIWSTPSPARSSAIDGNGAQTGLVAKRATGKTSTKAPIKVKAVSKKAAEKAGERKTA
ncbi:MAG TPA: response regulator [Acidobacteriaceae bacterium]|nr:response regulator [Acidobacteriaceae bacterium]